jgi:YidC/Oxa1 family membrane protein insertase
MFTEVIIRPLLNLTVSIYGTVGFADFGLTVILVTLVVRLAVLPFSLKTARSQREMAKLAPQLEQIKVQHKGNMQAQSEATMRLYKEHGVNPLAGCLPLLIQLPILFGMYRVFLDIFKPETLNLLYGFVPNPGTINQVAFGVLDISTASPILAVLAGAIQFIQARMTQQMAGSKSPTASMNKQMMYILPAMIVVIGWSLPAGLPLYWIVTTLVSIGEQLHVRRS